MKTRIICLAVCMMIASVAFSQFANYDTSRSISYAKMTLPDSLMSKYRIQANIPDTTNRKLIAQTKSVDTVNKTQKEESKLPEAKPTVKKHDKRWFISPLLKFQAQDFGMMEKRRKGYLSDAETLSFREKSNLSAAGSVYKNLTKNFSMSLDAGFSQGRVTGPDSLISQSKKQNFGLVNATMYFHPLGGQYKLQPFLAAGFNSLFGKGAFMSAPMGVGVKFSSKKIMMETQAAYGYAMSKNIAPNMMYSLGIYLPLKRKKDEEEENGKDTSRLNITNITNNYYLINIDSLKKAKEDSISKAKADQERLDKIRRQQEIDSLDADDPMRLPAAVKNIVYFNYDSYSLTSAAFNSVDRVIQQLKDNKILHVHLKGYTDLSGSEQYNSALSKRRAQMVYDYMNSRGVPAERIILSAFGKNNPVVKGNDPGTAWMNRRCEIVIYEKK